MATRDADVQLPANPPISGFGQSIATAKGTRNPESVILVLPTDPEHRSNVRIRSVEHKSPYRKSLKFDRLFTLIFR